MRIFFGIVLEELATRLMRVRSEPARASNQVWLGDEEMRMIVPVCVSKDDLRSEEKTRIDDVAVTEHLARQRLSVHPHFRSRSSAITLRCERDVLILSGKAPSFYLKQLVQEVLRDVMPRIQNDIDVISCEGLSSIRDSGWRD